MYGCRYNFPVVRKIWSLVVLVALSEFVYLTLHPEDVAASMRYVLSNVF